MTFPSRWSFFGFWPIVALATRGGGESKRTKDGFRLARPAAVLNSFATDSNKDRGLMAPLPPPQGMSEVDYETIEAAVTETVRGRWFLGEFARRNRTAELRQLLDAMARIEGVVSGGAPTALPPSDPSIRMLMQRVKEIAAHLETLSGEMREAGVDPRFPESVELQARAVAGMMRGPGRNALPRQPEAARVSAAKALPPAEVAASVEPTRTETPAPSASVRLPRADLPASLERRGVDDPRLAALSALDGLALADKLALFS